MIRSSRLSPHFSGEEPWYEAKRYILQQHQKLGWGYGLSSSVKTQLQMCKWYCIAGNFRGRKPLQISRFCGCLRTFSLQNLGVWHLLVRHKRVIDKSFLCENHIFQQFAKVFSFESLSLYGPAAYTGYASPAWLGSLWPGAMSATTVVSWTMRIWPLPGRGLKPWPPRRTKFQFLLVRRPRSRPCPSSHGAVGVRSTSWCGVSVVRLSVGALVMRSPTKGKY